MNLRGFQRTATTSDPPARSPGQERRRRTRGPAVAGLHARTAPAPRCRGRTHRGRVEHKDVPEPLPMEPPQRPSELRLLVADDVRAEVPIGSLAVALPAELLGQVENNCHRQAVILPGQLHQWLACFGLDVGGVNHRDPPQGQPLPGDEPEHLERLVRDRLVVLIVADHPSAGVRRENLRRPEVPACERALARPAGSDQDEEAEIWDLEGSRGITPLLSSGPAIPGRT
jgi:hypothetical protein